MNTTTLATFLLPILAATSMAQGPQTLVGMTRLNPALRKLSPNCNAISQCSLPGMPGANNVFAGGTAWDARTSGAWVTNGQVIAKYGDDCDVQCPPMPVPQLSSANTVITGLEVVDGSDQLWMLDSEGRIRFFSNTCPPVPQGGCNSVLIPSTTPVQVTTGLAIDEGIGLVFVAFANLTNATTRIAVNNLNDPCQTFEIIDVPQCFTPFGAITGLACDWGSNQLYATDGNTTIRMNYAWNGSNLFIVNHSCCPGGIAIDSMVGLAVRPGRATSFGQPCANGSCANCPMVHTLGNDPVLGNTDFRLDLDGAFGSSFSFCLIGDGPCSPAPSVPPMCGPIHTVPFIGYLGPNLIQGLSICGNSTSFNFPLPLTPSLVNQTYSSQCVNLCVTGSGALGFSNSNCLSWTLQGI